LPTQAHLIGQNATHALNADLVHPSQALELVIPHGATDQAFGLLRHSQVVLANGLAVQTGAHSAECLGLARQDAAECSTLGKELVQVLSLGIALELAQRMLLGLLPALVLGFIVVFPGLFLLRSKNLLLS
jgi:hypothetical protein